MHPHVNTSLNNNAVLEPLSFGNFRPALKRIDFWCLHTPWEQKRTKLKLWAKSLSWFFSVSYLQCLLLVHIDSELGSLLSFFLMCHSVLIMRENASKQQFQKSWIHTLQQSCKAFFKMLFSMFDLAVFFLNAARRTCVHYPLKVGMGPKCHLPYGQN